MMVILSLSLLLNILSIIWIFLIHAHPNKKRISKADIVNQNFTFIAKEEEKGKWTDFKKAKLTVYNPVKDEEKKLSGKTESYFWKD